MQDKNLRWEHLVIIILIILLFGFALPKETYSPTTINHKGEIWYCVRGECEVRCYVNDHKMFDCDSVNEMQLGDEIIYLGRKEND
jgi:hypothetical protein